MSTPRYVEVITDARRAARLCLDVLEAGLRIEEYTIVVDRVEGEGDVLYVTTQPFPQMLIWEVT